MLSERRLIVPRVKPLNPDQRQFLDYAICDDKDVTNADPETVVGIADIDASQVEVHPHQAATILRRVTALLVVLPARDPGGERRRVCHYERKASPLVKLLGFLLTRILGQSHKLVASQNQANLRS